MAMLADTLSWYLNQPVVDRTALKGNYDVRIDISSDDFRAMSIRPAVVAGVVLPSALMSVLERPWGDSVTTGLNKAGLKLERRRAPLEVVIIDSIDRKPSDN